MTRTLPLSLLLLFGGCLGDQDIREPTPNVIDAYHRVNAGLAGRAQSDGYRFERYDNTVEATRTIERVCDDEAYSMLDDSVRALVHRQLDFDRALAPRSIAVRVTDRRVFLSGAVDSEANAVRAVYDALVVAGVRSVQSALLTVQADRAARAR